VAARELVLGGLDDDRALGVATAVEGHPDNVAAALFGGLTIAWRDPDGSTQCARLPVASALTPVAFVPSGVKVSTAKARALLPDAVPHAEAAATAGRAALLTAAIGGRLDLLLAATEDRLHQPYRLGAQPRGAQLVERLRASGHAAVLSGSGPTILALCTSRADADAAATLGGRSFEAMELDVDSTGATVIS
jgi:homoserine kinase